jgi:4-hydroxybenzoate polyprenyltransferase
VLAHGLLILAFSSCAVVFASVVSGGGPPAWPDYLTAFPTCFIFFLQLRIADEFKDADEDARFRPYRPVPRGLVTLGGLRTLFLLGAALQLGLALWHHRALALILLAAWAYLALMSVEFFAREWLKARPVTYLWTHMLIMPIVDFYATAVYWLPRTGHPPSGLALFLAASFANGLVIELGRKLRQPHAEEDGVPTYTRLWGMSKAP